MMTKDTLAESIAENIVVRSKSVKINEETFQPIVSYNIDISFCIELKQDSIACLGDEGFANALGRSLLIKMKEANDNNSISHSS